MKQCYSRTGILRVKILGAAPGMQRVRAVALRVLTWRSHAQSSFTVVGPIRVPWRCQAPYRVSTFIPSLSPIFSACCREEDKIHKGTSQKGVLLSHLWDCEYEGTCDLHTHNLRGEVFQNAGIPGCLLEGSSTRQYFLAMFQKSLYIPKYSKRVR